MVQDIRTLGLPALMSFHTVARLGGISAAAERLGMAKSGVSRHVAQLEDQLGVRLLERGARSVRLTPVGQRLDYRIASILAEIDMLRDVAQEEASGISGHVSIAATPEFGGLVARGFFPAMGERYPGITLSLRPAYEFEDMQDPNTDIAFRVGTFKDDRLVARKLGAFSAHVVASPDVAKRHPVTAPEELSGVPCLIFHGSRAQGRWTLFSGDDEERAVDVSGPVAVRSFTTLMELAMDGRGYAILPAFMLAEALAAGTLIRCLPSYASRTFPVYLTYRPGARQVARLEATISAAEEMVPALLSESLASAVTQS